MRNAQRSKWQTTGPYSLQIFIVIETGNIVAKEKDMNAIIQEELKTAKSQEVFVEFLNRVPFSVLCKTCGGCENHVVIKMANSR